ncbi:MAG TPA: dipeptide/oligopeptide/nickel ABC transporter ATP-binding protein [Vicinamibacterales bacterium]|nr:dipeptide/oligopeptide/nickel ABC transporter ATP-binding protein [Vicinamibacterales bacterium]
MELADVCLSFRDSNGNPVTLIRSATLTIDSEEIVGLVGASGSGKTTLARAILGILPDGVSCTGHIRTRRPIAYIDQDPGGTFNPVRRVGSQITEVLRWNCGLGRRAAVAEAHRLFQQLSLPASLLDAYPHQLSGGQQQRAAIARAVASGPALVIADEPGSALDVVTQLEFIDTLLAWRAERRFSVLLISHEASLIRGLCDRVVRLEHGALHPERIGRQERCA